LARLRDGYTDFTSRKAEILAIGPVQPSSFTNYWRENQIPFIGLPDIEKKVSKVYKQEINLLTDVTRL